MRPFVLAACYCSLLGLSASGCGQGGFLVSQQNRNQQLQQQQLAQNSQLSELRQRARQLDVDNQELQAMVGDLKQQVQLVSEEKDLLRKRLADAASQLKGIQTAKKETDRRLQALQASTLQNGGAIITANNSLRERLKVVSVPGVEVRQENDVIRFELPSDRLFVQGTGQLQQTATTLLDQVATTVRANYGQHIVVIEGHTDSSPSGGTATSSHQLAASQALAVFDRLMRSGGIPANQLRIMSHGDSHPRFSNATLDGRKRNRRIELVIYPETVDGND